MNQSLFLSQIDLNPKSMLAMSDAQNPYALHLTLVKLLRETEVCLYRQSKARDQVLLQTPRLLRQSELAHYATVRFSHPLTRPEVGVRLNFKLRLHTSKKNNGKRIAIPADEQEHYIERFPERGGFELEDYTMTHRGRIKAHKGTDTGLRAQYADFEGRLRITDADDFWDSRRLGVGQARMFGCGLLLLAYAGQNGRRAV